MPFMAEPMRPGRAPDISFEGAPRAATVIPITALPPVAGEPVSVEQELEEWKRARKYRAPWRQISLIASLSFGIASFVLPSTLDDVVQWVLIVLSAMSFTAWATGRTKA